MSPRKYGTDEGGGLVEGGLSVLYHIQVCTRL